jgi:phage shock protein C
MTERLRPSPSKLYKNRGRGKIAGVCAGVADYVGIPALVVRVVAVIALFMLTLPTLVIYFGAAWLLDDAPERLYDSPEEERFWRRVRATPSKTATDLRHRFWEGERRLRRIEAHITSKEFELRRKFRDLETGSA